MNQPVASQADKKNIALTNQKTIAGLLDQMKAEIKRCLPAHLTPERMTRIALTELRKTPKLQECDPMSFIAAIMQASQLGLEPGVLGSCYLIPFNNNKTGKVECNFIPGYRGFLDLARRSGQIVSLTAHTVYENDTFEYEYGLEEKLIHKPTMGDKGNLIAVYSVAKLKDGGHQFEVMSKVEVDAIRKQSKSSNFGPWVTHYDEMAKKSVLRKLFKWLPCSVEMQKATVLDEHADAGIQDIKSAASEDFNIDFSATTYDAETGEILEPETNINNPVKQVDEVNSKLDNVIKEMPKQGNANLDQLTMMRDIIKNKKLNAERVKSILQNFNCSNMEHLSSAQADAFIISLNKV